MKLKAIVIAAFFALGVLTSVAVAKGPPPGKGPGEHGKGKQTQSASTSTGATTTDRHAAKKMWICHRTGSSRFVRIRINNAAWPAHRRHGDVALGPAGGSTTGTTATTGTTSTGTKRHGAGSCAGVGAGGTTTGTTTAP